MLNLTQMKDRKKPLLYLCFTFFSCCAVESQVDLKYSLRAVYYNMDSTPTFPPKSFFTLLVNITNSSEHPKNFTYPFLLSSSDTVLKSPHFILRSDQVEKLILFRSENIEIPPRTVVSMPFFVSSRHFDPGFTELGDNKNTLDSLIMRANVFLIDERGDTFSVAKDKQFQTYSGSAIGPYSSRYYD